jgi:hypothetical protein
MLRIEHKRSERSKKKFFLLLTDITVTPARDLPYSIQDIIFCFSPALRETDIRGWYDEGTIIGVIFPEMDDLNKLKRVIQKLKNQLNQKFMPDLSSAIKFSYLTFPEKGSKSKRSTESPLRI